jgi:spore maturation protein CgeB
LQELARCKISLNFRGAGWDTLRYWEVPALAGFMISQKPGIVIKNNFVDNKEIIFCNDDLSDLLDLCRYYLKNEDEREIIARRALAKMKDHHTDIHRAKEIITTCRLS